MKIYYLKLSQISLQEQILEDIGTLSIACFIIICLLYIQLISLILWNINQTLALCIENWLIQYVQLIYLQLINVHISVKIFNIEYLKVDVEQTIEWNMKSV